MNDQDFINFKKVRDLGSMFSDTSKFLAAEWKPFFGTILKIAIIPILIAVCAMVYFGITFLSFFGDFSQVVETEDFSDINFSSIALPTLVFFISYTVAFALVTVASYSYIKSYIVHKGIVNYQEVQSITKEKFWTSVGLFILIGIMIVFGTLFCFLPGIYLWVVLSLSICLVIFQKKGVFDAIGDSFSFIKEHWWETFGILLVVQIVIAVVSFMIDLPASLYQNIDVATLLEGQDPYEVLSFFSDPVYLALVAISYFVKIILYLISTIFTVFIYYDIKEQKNPSSDMIDEIGIG